MYIVYFCLLGLPDVSDDTLRMFFEVEKYSGGGPVESHIVITGEQKAVITFKKVEGLSLSFRVRNLKFATSKTLVNFMKKMMFLSHNWYFSVQKALIYYTVNKSHHNSFILLVFSHVANFRYVANFRFLTLLRVKMEIFSH